MKRISTILSIVVLLFLQLHSVELAKSVAKSTTSLFPAPQKQLTWNAVQKKLAVQKDTYSLHYSSSLIPTAHAASIYDNASSYITIDYQSGDVLLQKNPDASVPIASLTKIMTAIVALDLMTPQEQITISQNAPTVVPTKIGVDSGERMSLSDLLQAMLMYSANDAAQAVHDGVNERYSQPLFIQAMNEKAQLLGLTHTHFANPQGFDDPNNYSSAADLAVLSHYALSHYPLIAQIVSQDYTVEPATAAHKAYDLPNWNGLLGVYPGVSGIKIGNTENAGYTTVVASERDGKKVLAVVLGTPGILQRDEWTATLLDDTFAQEYNLPPVNITPSQLQAKYASWYQQ